MIIYIPSIFEAKMRLIIELKSDNELLTQKKERREPIESEYDEIMALKGQGTTHEEIGLELGVSKSTISKKISRYNNLLALETSTPK